MPPDRYCLIATNYKLKAAVPPKKLTKSALGEGRSTIKSTIKGGLGAGGGAAAKRQNVGGIGGGLAAKQQTVNIPKPVFKFSTKTATSKPKPEGIKTEMDDDGGSGGGSASSAALFPAKRKREEDDFQIVG